MTGPQKPSHSKLLDDLPGLVGALDKAIFDTAGEQLPFTLLVYAPGGAMHASNFNAQEAVRALKLLAEQWDNPETAPTAH
jgi:hypothetical protein